MPTWSSTLPLSMAVLSGTNFIWKIFQSKSNKPIPPAHLENVYVKYSDQKDFMWPTKIFGNRPGCYRHKWSHHSQQFCYLPGTSAEFPGGEAGIINFTFQSQPYPTCTRLSLLSDHQPEACVWLIFSISLAHAREGVSCREQRELPLGAWTFMGLWTELHDVQGKHT